ncbi:hypothetical protein EDD21DRAFT_386334 [Dissophora ornata]|nr:hypothetical protein EDD21DRAFT_386334 [Dissophora ornata]
MTLIDFDPDDFPIVVAIDFGTTFSGCAYAFAPDDREARIITGWPKQNIQYAKTPTLNLYQKLNGEFRMAEWGWKSKLAMQSPTASKYVQLHQYKPYLDESVALTPWKSENGVSVLMAISDYLGALHEYVADKILQEFGPSYSRKSFRYCLTVPAMWSDKSKDVMRKAAIKAKIITETDHPDRLMLVSEPEAAALYCERQCRQYDLGHGDRFMICDAGGGTVDLIVYEIAVSSQGRSLSEVTHGHGASCGSMFIDMNFGDLLIEEFGKQSAKVPTSIISDLVEKFAYELKPHFDGVEDQHLALPLNDCFEELENLGAIGIDGGYMCLKASELKSRVFEPVVKKVLALIQEQLDGAKNVSAIFMVGGFGASTYLLNRVKQEFSSKVRTISAPYKPEAAVVCGAVYAGLNPKVITARITRRCYGIGMEDYFNENIDTIELKIFRKHGITCTDRFKPFVRKAQKDQVCTYYSVPIYAINGDPPRHTTAAGMSKLATILIPNPFKSSDPIGRSVGVV